MNVLSARRKGAQIAPNRQEDSRDMTRSGFVGDSPSAFASPRVHLRSELITM